VPATVVRLPAVSTTVVARSGSERGRELPRPLHLVGVQVDTEAWQVVADGRTPDTVTRDESALK